MQEFRPFGVSVMLAQAAPSPLEPKIRAMCQLGDRMGAVTPLSASGPMVQDALDAVLSPLSQENRNDVINTAMARCKNFKDFWLNWTVQGGTMTKDEVPEEEPPEQEEEEEPEREAVPTGAGRKKRCFLLPDGSYQMMYPSVAPAGSKVARTTQCQEQEEEEPEPIPTTTWEETPPGIPDCYACAPGDYRRLTPAQAQAAGCTKTTPANCEPPPTLMPTPTRGIPTGGLQVRPPTPIPTQQPAATPTQRATTTSRQAPVPQPTPTPTPMLPGRSTDWGAQAQAPSDRYSWGGGEAAAAAERGAAGCPPGQFWDGVKCRGAIDYGALQAYGGAAMAPGAAAPGATSITPTGGMTAPSYTMTGPRRVSQFSMFG